jgi:hypothetical protein
MDVDGEMDGVGPSGRHRRAVYFPAKRNSHAHASDHPDRQQTTNELADAMASLSVDRPPDPQRRASDPSVPRRTSLDETTSTHHELAGSTPLLRRCSSVLDPEDEDDDGFVSDVRGYQLHLPLCFYKH